MTATTCYTVSTGGKRLVTVVTGSEVFGLVLQWPVVSLDWTDNYSRSSLKTQTRLSCLHLVLYEKGVREPSITHKYWMST
jgi:hypothetical protein